ncbi:MAG: zinc-finger domain-containing protein [Pseudomonadota bacterium]
MSNEPATPALRMPNDRNEYEINASDLPLHCPLPGTTLWNSHPRVFIEVGSRGVGKCPYCGAVYRLVAGKVVHS